MSSVQNGQDRTYPAGEDLSSSKYLFVTMETGSVLDLADAATDKAFGVLQQVPLAAVGSECNVRVNGQTKVVAKEALAVDDFVAPATDGKAQVAVAGQYARGVVVFAAGAEDDVAVIELFKTADDLQGAETLQSLTITDVIVATTAGAVLGFYDISAAPVTQPTHNADPVAMVTQTAVDPDAVTGVTMGDLVSTTAGWGSSSEAGFDKITTAVDQLIADILTIRTQLVATVADVDAAETAIAANKAAIDAINADDATLGLTAAS